MGEIEAKVDGFAETVEAIVFAKEAHERHQAKEEVPDPMPARGSMHERRVRESIGTNAPETAFTSSDLRGEPAGYQPAFDVGVQVHTEDIRVPKERYVTVSTPQREKKTSEGYGDDGDESHSSSDEADRDKDRKKKKGLTRAVLGSFPLKFLFSSLPSWSRSKWWTVFSRHASKYCARPHVVPLLTLLLALVAFCCRFATKS